MDPDSRVPMVGASGAIAGVMGAYLVKFPRSRVVMLTFLLFIFTFEVPAWLMLIYWFALQVFGGVGAVTEASQGGMAFFAHVGGFLDRDAADERDGAAQALLAAAGPVLVMKRGDALHARGCHLCDDAKKVLGGGAAAGRVYVRRKGYRRRCRSCGGCTTNRCR